jgi:hypothetical protein
MTSHELGHGDADEAAGDSIRSGGSGRDGRGGEGSDKDGGKGGAPQGKGQGREGGDEGGVDSWVEQHEKVCQVVERSLGLLAYQNPQESPLKELLQPSQRMVVADAINECILESQGHQKTSKLEVLIQHLLVSHHTLRHMQGGRGERLDLMAPFT